MSDDSQIYFLVEEPVDEVVVPIEGERDGRTDTGGGFGPPRRSRADAIARYVRRQRVGIDAAELKAQMQELQAVVNELFAQSSPSVESPASSGLRLEEVTLSVQVNAKGQLSILGTGGELSGSGGITLKFARPKS